MIGNGFKMNVGVRMKKQNVIISVAALLVVAGVATGFLLSNKRSTPTDGTAPLDQTIPEGQTAIVDRSEIPNSDSSCVVLEEEHCSSAEAFDIDGVKMIGFRLPVGTQIFAPFAGELSISPLVPFDIQPEDEVTFIGEVLSVRKLADTERPDERLAFRSAGSYIERLSSGQVERGSFIATVGESKTNPYKDYNVILVFDKFDPRLNYSVADADLTQQFFQYVKI